MVSCVLQRVQIQSRLLGSDVLGFWLVDHPLHLAGKRLALDAHFKSFRDDGQDAEIGDLVELAEDVSLAPFEADDQFLLEQTLDVGVALEDEDQGTPLDDSSNVIVGLFGGLAEEAVEFDDGLGLILTGTGTGLSGSVLAEFSLGDGLC